MRQTILFSLLFTAVFLLMVPNPVAALMSPEAYEIPYQINNSDHIVIGKVNNIEAFDNYTDNTIAVNEWLYNPLPSKTIIVRTNMGAHTWQEDEAQFNQNESVLLMLNDQNPDKGIFSMSIGSAGKHPISDRDAVIKELKAQGKWTEENQSESNTTTHTGTVDQQGKKSKNTSFISFFWVLAIMLGTVLYLKKES